MSRTLGRTILGAGMIGLVAVAAAGCGKPCEPIRPSATAERLGIVLGGGRLCDEDRSVAGIDYPDSGGAKGIAALYAAAMGKAGWKLEVEAGGTQLFTRETDTLFIVAVDRTKDRGVPWAAVRYCEDSSCRGELTALATAMKARTAK